MGQSVDAYIAYGWIMPEGRDTDDDELFDLIDSSDTLEIGFAGSMYAGDMETVIYLKDTEQSTNWCSKALNEGFTDIGFNTEGAMRKEAERIGITLPDTPASWILWPCLV